MPCRAHQSPMLLSSSVRRRHVALAGRELGSRPGSGNGTPDLLGPSAAGRMAGHSAALHHPRPFTLIELLVAALAGAVLLAALLAALSGAWRLQEQSAAREKVEAPRDAARQRLTRDLRYAVPPSGLLAGAFAALTEAVGDYRHDDVEWVTAIGASNSDDACGDLVSVHYYLNAGAASDVFALVRTETRHLLAVETEEPEEVVILENVVSFAVDWYDGDTWQESWDSTANENQLPLAARVRVEFAAPAGGGAGPLDLIVALDMRTLSATEVATP